MRIIVVGYIVRCPLGGMAWHYLQYVLGLARLGHDVYFFEESGDSRLVPVGATTTGTADAGTAPARSALRSWARARTLSSASRAGTPCLCGFRACPPAR